MPRIAHIVTHPIQYFAPLYRLLSESPEIELTVLFGSDFGTKPSFDPGLQSVVQFDTPLLEGYRFQFLRNLGDGQPGGNSASFDCPDILSVLKQGQFDCVWIHGWGYRFQKQAARAAQEMGIPYLIRGESTLLDAPKYSFRWLRRFLLHGPFLRRATACLYVGEKNRQFLRSMGVAEDRLLPANYSVDTDFFQQGCLNAEERRQFRDARDITPDQIVVVTVAKLIARKRVADIVRAVARCQSNVTLWVLGDGELAEPLKTMAGELLPGRVNWFGFTNQRAIPAALSAADLFILASDEETWGLVVNEAMACGLPAVVSDKVGCGADLIRAGETGSIFPCGDIKALAACIQAMSNPESLSKLKTSAAARVVEHYSARATADQLLQAFRTLDIGRFPATPDQTVS